MVGTAVRSAPVAFNLKPVIPRLIGVIEAEARGSVDIQFSPPPRAGLQRATVRALPYPFANYLTISNDCDYCELHDTVQALALFRETYGLPITDSFFADHLLWGAQTTDRTEQKKDHLAFEQDNAVFLQHYHRGWTDVLHGYVGDQGFRIADPVRLEVVDCSVEATLSFRLPSDWSASSKPRYFSFSAEMPIAGSSLRLSLSLDGQTLLEVSPAVFYETPLLSQKTIAIDLWEAGLHDLAAISEIEAKFTLFGPAGAFLSVDAPMLATILRSDVVEIEGVLSRYGLRPAVFTSHCYGLMFGVRVMSCAGADHRCESDDPKNPHYCFDLLRGSSLRFFNSFNNTTQYDLLGLENLLFANVAADGAAFYDFRRYMPAPRTDAGSVDFGIWFGDKATNPSRADGLGPALGHALLELERRPLTGGLVYTHFYALSAEGSRGDVVPPGSIFGTKLFPALQQLQDRYYNLPGTVSDSRRIFVAPSSILLRLAQVLKATDRHALVDKTMSRVEIRSWVDPITGERLPSAQRGYRELRYVDFEVDDPSLGSLAIDGEDVGQLVRLRRSDGRGFIRIADASEAFVAVSPNVVPREPGFWGEPDQKGFYRVRPGGSLQHSGGILDAYPLVGADFPVRDFAHIAFRGRGDFAHALGLRLRDHSGRSVDVPPERIWRRLVPCARVAPGSMSEWFVIPIAMLFEGAVAQSGPFPIGLKAAVYLVIYGEPAGGLEIERVEFWRDCENQDVDEFVLLGGIVRTAGVEQVKIVIEGKEYRTRPGAAGSYFFPRLARRGDVISIAGITADCAEIPSIHGQRIEVKGNVTFLDF